jgi:hypothetical protein
MFAYVINNRPVRPLYVKKEVRRRHVIEDVRYLLSICELTFRTFRYMLRVLCSSVRCGR